MESDKLSEIRTWTSENPLTLLVFTTPDCGVCNALRPRIDQMAVANPRLHVRYVNLEEAPEVAGQYGVFAVPVYLLSVQGKEAVRFTRHFGMRELTSAVERYSSLLGNE